ncbi:MAG TPA: lysophospholipid acyltransferase family protein [Tepidisphaeraceae bacterium]|nr:lysophospholipid acyltransferase family protein [Tepidisphaeraceae bacterium]
MPSRTAWDRLRVVWLNLWFWTAFTVVTLVFAVIVGMYLAAFGAVLRQRRRMLRRLRRSISIYGEIVIRLGWPLVRVRYVDLSPGDKPPFVFVANHLSSSDAFLMAVLPFECIQVLNNWPDQVPFVKWFSRAAGYLRIRQMTFEEFIAAGTKLLADGVSIIVFPEGTRSRNGETGPFHGAAFRLAQMTGANLCPLAISGNHRMPARGSLLLHPGRVQVTKLPALTRQQYDGLQPYVLKTRVRDAIKQQAAAMPA